MHDIPKCSEDHTQFLSVQLYVNNDCVVICNTRLKNENHMRGWTGNLQQQEIVNGIGSYEEAVNEAKTLSLLTGIPFYEDLPF